MTCGKRFLAFLAAFLLLCSVATFGDVTLTEEEYSELMTIFAKWESTLTTQEAELKVLQSSLETAESELAKSQNAITSLEATLQELRQSYAEQGAVHLRRVVVTAVVSAVVGFAGGVTLVLVL